MQKHYRSWTTAVACCLLAACIGCNGTTPDEPPNGPDNGAEPGDPGAEPTGGNGATPAAEPAPPPTVPEVALMEADRAKCKVQVDDAMPAGELSDLAGQVHSLPALYGAKLTVIHLWQSGATAFSAMAAEDALEFLAKDVAEPFAEQGVAVLGVNVGDSAEAAQKHLETAQAKFPNFLDPNGVYFAQVATEKLPRTYLIGADGKIIWFDLEFSEITRAALRQAIEVKLKEE